MTDKEITSIENKMREKLEDPNINLIVRTLKTTISDHDGEMLYGWIYYEDLDHAKKKELIELDSIVEAKFKNYEKLFPVNIHKKFENEDISILIKAVSTEPITPQEIRKLEVELSDQTSRNVNVDVWYKSDAIITRDGYKSFEDYNESNIYELEQKFRQGLDAPLDLE